MTYTEKIKLFHISQLILENDLDKVERQYGINLGRDCSEITEKDDEYYPQFSEAIRREARDMGAHYELFYCLEKSIRELVKEKLQSEHGVDWWDRCVPEEVKNNVKANIKKEVDSGITQRSTEPLDYTTFGELAVIVQKNWLSFGDTFNSDKAYLQIMARLNLLRGPIAHCSFLAPDEVMRLRLTMGDWFRLME